MEEVLEMELAQQQAITEQGWAWDEGGNEGRFVLILLCIFKVNLADFSS